MRIETVSIPAAAVDIVPPAVSVVSTPELPRGNTPGLPSWGEPIAPATLIVAPRPATMSLELRSRRTTLAAERVRECLATAIYFEARGESQRGQVAVAQVILNRAAAAGFPKTVCGVVYQNAHRRNACQFSFACDGKADRILEPGAWRIAKRIASDVIAGRSRVSSVVKATYYHATYVSPRWAPKMKRLARIGQHIFYDA